MQQGDEGRGEQRRREAWRMPGLVGVLTVALAARLIAITWGLPDGTHLFSYHPDEYHSLRGAISLALGDLNPHFFNYGSLYLYLVGAAASLAEPELFAGLAHAAPGSPAWPAAIREWTLDARIITAILGVCTVAVVYELARVAWGHREGVVAGLLLALAPLHVLQSHYATVDVPAALFTTLTLLLSVRMVIEPSARNAAWAGVTAGLAASTKYSGALVLVAPMTAWLVAWWRARESDERGAPLLSLILPPVVALATFAITSPYTFLDWPSAREAIAFEMRHMQAGDDPWMLAAWPSGYVFHLAGLTAAVGAPAMLAAVAGVVVAAVQRRRELLPVLAFGLVVFAVIGHTQVRYARYEVALLPVLAVAAAALASPRRRPEAPRLRTVLRMAGIAIVVGAILFAGVTSGLILHGLATQQARAGALQFLEENVPAGGAIGLVSEPWFHHPPVDYCNGGAALRRHPLWVSYRRPLRELQVLGLDANALARRPKAVVVTEYEVPPPLLADGAAGDAGKAADARAFVTELRRLGYRRGWSSPEAPLPEGVGGPMGRDWRYPFPRIAVWVRDGDG